MFRIYFTGAQSTGKTTLAGLVADRYGLPMVTGAARREQDREGKTLDEIRADPTAVDRFQLAIFEGQLSAEEAAQGGFVADRAFDSMCYAAQHSSVASVVYRDPRFHQYIDRLRHPNVRVFFVRPQRNMLINDHHRSANDLTWEAMCRFDAQLQLLLEMFGVPYVPVSCFLLKDRARVVYGVLDGLAKGTTHDPKVVHARRVMGMNGVKHLTPETSVKVGVDDRPAVS